MRTNDSIMNTEIVEPVKTAHKDILQIPKWTSLRVNAAGEITETSDFIEPEKVKISIPVKTQKEILDRYTGFMKIPLMVKS